MRDWWENPHISLTARASFAGRAYPAYLRRITQIFGDRKFAYDKIVGCKGWKTRNGHTSSPISFELINGNFHPHTSALNILVSTHCEPHWAELFFRTAVALCLPSMSELHLTPRSHESRGNVPRKRTSMGPRINLFRDGGGGYSSHILWAPLRCFWWCFDQPKLVIKPSHSFLLLTLWSCLFTVPQLNLSCRLFFEFLFSFL